MAELTELNNNFPKIDHEALEFTSMPVANLNASVMKSYERHVANTANIEYDIEAFKELNQRAQMKLSQVKDDQHRLEIELNHEHESVMQFSLETIEHECREFKRSALMLYPVEIQTPVGTSMSNASDRFTSTMTSSRMKSRRRTTAQVADLANTIRVEVDLVITQSESLKEEDSDEDSGEFSAEPLYNPFKSILADDLGDLSDLSDSDDSFPELDDYLL